MSFLVRQEEERKLMATFKSIGLFRLEAGLGFGLGLTKNNVTYVLLKVAL